jgi:hypothetical protein
MTEHDGTAERLAALEAEVTNLRARLAGFGETAAPARPAGGRRGVLKLAGAAAVGVAAAGLAGARPAAAATGDTAFVGMKNSSTAPTILQYGSGSVAAADDSGMILKVDAGGHTNIGIAAIGAGTGLFSAGSTFGVNASGDYPYAIYFARKANLHLSPWASDSGGGVLKTPPPDRSDAYIMGDLDIDPNGDLWFCVAGGTPGTWRKVAGAATGGAFHPITPTRVYDSREALPSPGVLASGQNRTISVADGRASVGGAVTVPDLVPAGAAAVAANVTVVSVAHAGYLAINPGGVTTVNASIVNWSAAGQALANAAPLAISADRKLTVVAGGGGSTHFIVDILGYWR